MATNLGYITVQGSISKDGVLEKVNTDSARALVVALSDPDRLLAATLMARMLNPKLLIICTASDTNSPWLVHAGASDVVFHDKLVANEIVTRLKAAGSKS